MTPPNVTPIRTEWLPTREAAARFGIHRRTLQRRARAGHVETRTRADGSVEYRCPATTAPQTGAATATIPQAPHPPQVDATPATDVLRAELAELRAALVDAERRAAVAEYRAAVAEAVDVDALRAEIERVTAERDAARDRVRELRTGTIARLARRIAELAK